MGASGSKSVTVTAYDTLKFSWWENSQSVIDNTTEVGWKLELVAGSAGKISTSNTRPWSVTVAGKDYSGNVSVAIEDNQTKTLASGTTTITHDEDGRKTFSYSFSQSFSGITFDGTTLGTVSGSDTGTLTNISRGLIYFDNGSKFEAYQVYVDNGSGWDHCIPYLDNGTTWDMCN